VGKKCGLQASSDFGKEATRVFGYTIAPHAAMKCGLPFGLSTRRLEVAIRYFAMHKNLNAGGNEVA
jgi:hypothetical protein